MTVASPLALDQLRSLYREHGSLVYSFALRVVGEQDAASLVRDVFSDAHRAVDAPVRGDGVPGWLLDLAIVRLDRDRRDHLDHRAVALVRDRVLVTAAISSLSPADQRIVRSVHGAKLTPDAVARHLETTVAEVGDALARARTQIARLLRRDPLERPTG